MLLAYVLLCAQAAPESVPAEDRCLSWCNQWTVDRSECSACVEGTPPGGGGGGDSPTTDTTTTNVPAVVPAGVPAGVPATQAPTTTAAAPASPVPGALAVPKGPRHCVSHLHRWNLPKAQLLPSKCAGTPLTSPERLSRQCALAEGVVQQMDRVSQRVHRLRQLRRNLLHRALRRR